MGGMEIIVKQFYDCETHVYENEVPVDEYLEACVDVPEFLAYCKQCGNYGKVWSCPEFSFDPMDYWRKYDTLKIIGLKIIVPEELRTRNYDEQERNLLFQELLQGYKKQLDERILKEEQRIEGSRALSGGSCLYCQPEDCSRIQGEPCRQPDKMRYSIEALGGNVGLTVTKYLHQELEWMEEGKLPSHFILVGGLLYAKT